MQKNRSKTIWNTKTMVILGMMMALNIVLTRVLAINIGGFVRLSLGSICSILTGLWFGPAAGGIAGAAADVVGMMLAPSGAFIPLITVSAAMWGILPGLMRPLIRGNRNAKIARIAMIVIVTSVVCQLGLTMVGLAGVYGWGIVPGRLIQFAGSTPLYCVITAALYFGPVTGMILQAPSDIPSVPGSVRGTVL